MEIIDRVLLRLQDDEPDKELVDELVQTAKDRILLRVGSTDTKQFPESLETIAVEVTVKAWRRQYFEGITSEGVDSINTSFVQDILAEYATELDMWKSTNVDKPKVRFL